MAAVFPSVNSATTSPDSPCTPAPQDQESFVQRPPPFHPGRRLSGTSRQLIHALIQVGVGSGMLTTPVSIEGAVPACGRSDTTAARYPAASTIEFSPLQLVRLTCTR